MSLCSRVLRGVALSAVILVPAVAYADSDGAAGTVASVTVNESSADDYAAERGNIYVLEAGGTSRKYTWGGQACSGRNVTEANIQLLFDAMRARDSVQVVPSYKPGGGGARCLVGFKLQPIPQGSTQ